MSGPIAALLRSLRLAGLDIDAEAALDSMWLGTRMLAAERARAAAAVATTDTSSIAKRPSGSTSRESERRSSGSFRRDSIAMRTAEFATPTSQTISAPQGDASAPARSITLERAAALPASRDLIRSLRPLRRRVVSPGTGILDLDATVRRAAEEDLWFPTFASARERWLDVLLVVDQGVSMIVWKDTVDELERVLRTSGAFRSVRSWWLETDAERVAVTARGRGASPSTPEALSRLTRGASRSVVLLVSDCVGARWHDGTIPRLVDVWSRALPVGLLQVTPEWFWARTALGDTAGSRFRSATPASTNRRFRWDATELGGPIDDGNGEMLRVPAATLTSDALARLASLIAGVGREWAPGVVFDLSWSGGDELEVAQPMNGAERVARFRALASKSAQRLAAGFAASPVRTLGVLRLLRRDLLPDATPFVEAEVLLGGIVRVKREEARWDLGASLPLELAPGVQPLLLDGAVAGDVLRVLAHAARVAESGIGETFTSWLDNPSSGEAQLDPSESAFAAEAAAALARLGGPYARIVKSVPSDDNGFVESETTADATRREERTTTEADIGEPHHLVRARRLYGREEELKRIEQWLDVESTVPLALVGEAGMGKSALAAEALAFWTERQPHGATPFVWAFLENPVWWEAIRAMYHQFGGRGLLEPSDNVDQLIAHLETRGPVMIVLDDVRSIPDERSMDKVLDLAVRIARLPGKRVVLAGRDWVPTQLPVEALYVGRLHDEAIDALTRELIASTASPDEIDSAIVSLLRRKHNMLVGESTAEEIRIRLGSHASGNWQMEVKGRVVGSGEPKTILFTSDDLREASQAAAKGTVGDVIRLAHDLGDRNPFVIQRLVAATKLLHPDEIREELIPDFATTGDEAMYIVAARAVEMDRLLRQAAVARGFTISGRRRLDEGDRMLAESDFQEVAQMRATLPSRRLRGLAAFDLSRAEVALGEHERAAENLDEILHEYGSALTDRERITVLQSLAVTRSALGQRELALARLREAIEIAASTSDSAVMVDLLKEFAQIAEDAGRYDDARDALARLKSLRGDLAPWADEKLSRLDRLRVAAEERSAPDEAVPIRVELIVRGRVSGVGYRQFAEQEARRLGISGSAQNLPDGTIRVQASGSRRTLELFRDRLREGPRGAVVSDVSVQILTETLRRAVIAVGVSRLTSTLPVLQSAIDAAQRVAGWALSSQRMASDSVVLLTDEKEPVNAKRIIAAMTAYAGAGVDQLIIYFAGYSSTVNHREFFHVTSTRDDPADAIDIDETRTMLRQSGVRHVVLITDTCRVSTMRAPAPSAIPLFDMLPKSPGVVDSFLSAIESRAHDQSNVANSHDTEGNDDRERASRYRAVYTRALLTALSGGEPSIQVERDGVMYVDPRAVADYAMVSMPKHLFAAGLSIDDAPVSHADIESSPDAWLARFEKQTPPAP